MLFPLLVMKARKNRLIRKTLKRLPAGYPLSRPLDQRKRDANNKSAHHNQFMRHMYGKILVAIDGSETSIKALDHAVGLAKVHGSSINLIAVIEELKLPFGAQYRLWANESHQELMRTSLESLNKEMMRVKDSKPRIKVDAIVREGDPASIIVRVADEEGYDLIVIGRKGMGIIEGLVMGSVTRKVVKTSNVTVTVVT